MDLWKKLLLKPGLRGLILNAPANYLSRTNTLPEGVELDTQPDGEYDFVHVFVSDQATLAAVTPTIRQVLKYDGLLWISYPKRSSKIVSDLTRDRGWEPISSLGLRPVTQVSIDEVWSALRFRPSERIGR